MKQKCGPLNNYKKCPSNQCCSSYGYCDDSPMSCHMKEYGKFTGDWLGRYDGEKVKHNKKDDLKESFFILEKSNNMVMIILILVLVYNLYFM